MTSKCDLTFDIETWFMHMILLLKVVNIFMKFHKNPSINVGDMLWTKSIQFIIFSDIVLPYINLNYMFHTRRSHDMICSGRNIYILSVLVTLTFQMLTQITCFTQVVIKSYICV
jgi:uncharacterized membrane protein YhaH (DUF805 family)